MLKLLFLILLLSRFIFLINLYFCFINLLNIVIVSMPLITFMSDFGLTDHYTAAVKAKIYNISSNIDIIDISHAIDSFNIAHGSFVLKAVYKDFPENTVHLVAVDSFSENGKYIAVKMDNHYFVSADNGLISLLNPQAPEQVVRLHNTLHTSFSAKEILAPAASSLALGASLTEIGEPVSDMNRKLPRMLKANRKQISGNVIQVDHYGNLITNIDRNTFEILSEDKNYSVVFGRESMHHIHHSYHDIESGECFLIFNDLDLLEIGIRQGNAQELLGITYDSPVQVLFD